MYASWSVADIVLDRHLLECGHRESFYEKGAEQPIQMLPPLQLVPTSAQRTKRTQDMLRHDFEKHPY